MPFKPRNKASSRLRSVHLYRIAIPTIILGLPFYWFNGVHTDYYAMVRASEAHAYAMQVADGLSKSYSKEGKLPSLEDVRTEMSRPPELKSIELRGDRTLFVQVTDLDEGEDALELVGTVNGSNHLQWSCQNVNLYERHIPFECRTK